MVAAADEPLCGAQPAADSHNIPSGDVRIDAQFPQYKKNGVDPFERLRIGYQEKEKGAAEFERQNYEGAIEAWCMAHGTIKHILERGFFEGYNDKIAECKDLRIKLNLNLAQASIHNKEFHQAIVYCNRVLEDPCEDACNTKALYRKGKALIMGSKFVEARVTLVKLLEVEPQNAAAKQLLSEADVLEKKAQKSARRASQKILDGMKHHHDYRVEIPLQEQALGWLTCSWCRRRLKGD